MITAVVFSRDRAMQIDLLLRSLPKELFPVYVIWRATSEDHDAAYGICASEQAERAAFYTESEGGLVWLARDLLDAADLACFLTDDSVFYRQPHLPDHLPYGVLCHSFRLGLNTTVCYPHNRTQKVPAVKAVDGVIGWHWQQADGDFAYPGSLDGHVFRASHLRRALMTVRADANPNQIEDHLNRWVGARLSGEFPLMTAEMQSSLVGIPTNRVTETHENRVGAGPSPDELCERYLSGERIALDRMDFADVRGAHQEITLEFGKGVTPVTGDPLPGSPHAYESLAPGDGAE